MDQVDQLVPVDRFLQQAHRTFGLHLVGQSLIRARGYHDDGDLLQPGNSPNFLEEVHSAAGRHLHVEQDDRRWILLGIHEPLHGIMRLEYQEARIAQDGGGQNDEGPIIVLHTGGAPALFAYSAAFPM